MTAADPYTDSSGVLRNLFGIASSEQLSQAEADLTFVRLLMLAENPLSGHYDLAHFQAFHRFVFQDVYDWAGELRTVGIARTEPFCLPQFLADEAARVFAAIRADDYLLGFKRDDFLDRLAHHLGEVNALHPFREGNGRTQRAYFGQLARSAGWRLRWSRLDSARNDLASRASLHGDPSPLRQLLDGLLEPG